jgi:hypothetical protein
VKDEAVRYGAGEGVTVLYKGYSLPPDFTKTTDTSSPAFVKSYEDVSSGRGS